MATNSILKNVNITDKRLGRSFVEALEQAKGKSAKDVQLSRTVSEVSGEELKRLFEVKQ
ncbi:MAG: hypothetical protein ACI4SS_01375 [Clostridia bacterium]